MTHAQILALPTNPNPRLIRASDTGFFYVIAAGAAGSTAINTGNASVPTDAPIQPLQVFVDVMTEIWAHNAETFVPGRPFASKGITTVEPTRFGYLMKWIVGPLRGFGYGDNVDFTENALNQASVDAVIAGCKLAVDEPLLGTSIPMNLDLSGGTNAPPSAQGLSDADYLINTGGWTVTTN